MSRDIFISYKNDGESRCFAERLGSTFKEHELRVCFFS